MEHAGIIALLPLLVCLGADGASAGKPLEWKDIVSDKARLEKAVSGFQFTEGPVWHPDGYLLFSDIPKSIIYRWTPGHEAAVFRTPSGHSNGLTLDRQGRLIACEHDRRVSRTEADGHVATLAERYGGKRLNSPNDVVAAANGDLYFTDPPYGIGREQEELGVYGVYRLTPDGALSRVADDFRKPNGLAFSPDGKRLYVDDTERAHIRVFDVRPDGTLAGGRVFAELREPGTDGAPDGLKVDTRGNVYCTGPGGVWVFTPDGRKLGRIDTPEVPTNCAFGDKDGKTLYITAQTSIYRIRLKNKGVRSAFAR